MAALYCAWCALCWVLRGGWFGDFYRDWRGIPADERPKITGFTRIVCAAMMAAPLAFLLGWTALWLWASIFVAMTIGYFGGSMGLTRARDYPLLAAWGVAVAFIATAPFHLRVELFSHPAQYAIFGDPEIAVWALLGGLAVVAYAANKPLGRRWGWDWTERGEALTGAAIGGAIYAALMRSPFV